MKDYFFNVFQSEEGWKIELEFKDGLQNHNIIFHMRESARIHSEKLNEIPLQFVEFNTLSKSEKPIKESFRYENTDKTFLLPR